MSVVIGCPVAHRAWILNDWFDHVVASCEQADLAPQFAFVIDDGDPCLEIIDHRAPGAVLEVVEPTKRTDRRVWNVDRYTYMVGLRNRLLGLVRGLAPDWFLSLDSDVLIAPGLVGRLAKDLDEGVYDAVGGGTYMSATGTRCPSWGKVSGTGQLQRYDAGQGYFPVEVIMAVKAMRPSAYGVDYVYDREGEDVGWSRACCSRGLAMGWDGRVLSKHVLEPHMLRRVDRRVGF